MPEPTVITSLDDFYEKFGYIDPVAMLEFTDRLEASTALPGHDPSVYDDEEVQLGWCKRCKKPIGHYHLSGCIYGGYVDPSDCQKFVDVAPHLPGLGRELN